MDATAFIRGDKVRNNFDGRIGTITGNYTPFGKSFRWEVGFSNGEPVYIRESYLEHIALNSDMFALFKQGRFNGVRDIRRIIQNIRLNGELTNLFYSMHNASTIFMPHQFKPVMKFIESTTGRLLIADEVGLGKTIEAIYIWKELITRENAKRLLIVCPAQLCQKWKDDLFNHFDIRSEICGAEKLLERLEETIKNYTNDSFVLITSIQGIRYREKENNKINNRNSRYKLNEFFDTFNAGDYSKLFDLVIIDEAHYLRNSDTASFSTGEKLRDNSTYMVLLSATPIQTSSDNLYNLLKLLSPQDYDSSDIFNILLQENKSVIAFANALRNNMPKDELKVIYAEIQDRYQESKTLNEKILSYLENRTNSDADRMLLFHSIKDTNFFSQFFTRTRKRDVFEKRIIRTAETLKYFFMQEEYEKYQEITSILKKLARNSSVSQVFTLIARQRQMTSCLPAALQHWKDHSVMEELLYEDMGFTEDDDNDIYNFHTDSIPQISISKEMIERFTANDSKFKKLVDAIKNILNENKHEKIIIFSYYRYTINYLFDRLRENEFYCIKIMGGMGEEKNDAITQFKDSPECNILISSEVGSEGIDLQFASVEINYDLPWNPMRLEQRIGRIDRIGQKEEKIRIFNFICENTIEDRVLDRLYQRIDIFKYAIGDIEEILGNEIYQLSRDLFTHDLSDEDLEQQAYQKIEAITLNKLDIEILEEQAGLSVEFSDFIQTSINNANSNKRYIMAEELMQYTIDFFSLNYNGTKIEKNDDKSSFITLSKDAQSAFREYVKKHHLQVSFLGYRNEAVLCIFSNNRDSYRKYKIFELIDINHAFIKWMKEISTNKSFDSYQCSAVKIKVDKIDNVHIGLYAYYIQKWQSEGYKNTTELKYYVIDTDTQEIIDENSAENLVVSSLHYGCDFSEIIYGLNNFDRVYNSLEKCKEYAMSRFNQYEANYYEENDLICDRNKEYVTRTYEKKINSLEEQIRKARETGQAERIIRMPEGRKSKTENELASKLNDLEKKKRANCGFSEIAIGLIKVEG